MEKLRSSKVMSPFLEWVGFFDKNKFALTLFALALAFIFYVPYFVEIGHLPNLSNVSTLNLVFLILLPILLFSSTTLFTFLPGIPWEDFYFLYEDVKDEIEGKGRFAYYKKLAPFLILTGMGLALINLITIILFMSTFKIGEFISFIWCCVLIVFFFSFILNKINSKIKRSDYHRTFLQSAFYSLIPVIFILSLLTFLVDFREFPGMFIGEEKSLVIKYLSFYYFFATWYYIAATNAGLLSESPEHTLKRVKFVIAFSLIATSVLFTIQFDRKVPIKDVRLLEPVKRLITTPAAVSLHILGIGGGALRNLYLSKNFCQQTGVTPDIDGECGERNLYRNVKILWGFNPLLIEYKNQKFQIDTKDMIMN